jgi:uncharacterized membrane protein
MQTNIYNVYVTSLIFDNTNTFKEANFTTGTGVGTTSNDERYFIQLQTHYDIKVRIYLSNKDDTFDNQTTDIYFGNPYIC